MPTMDQVFTPPPGVVREVVRARRIAAHAATTAILAALSPEPAMDTWISLGDAADRTTRRLARRIESDVP